MTRSPIELFWTAKNKASVGAYYPNLAHLGLSAQKFKLRAYPTQKLARLAKKKVAVACFPDPLSHLCLLSA